MAEKKATPKTITQQVDAFLLYNEQEKIVNLLADELESRKISIHFGRRDVPVGERISKFEEDRLKTARTVVVCLGKAGWGQTHLALTERSQKLKKKIVPVIIGPLDPKDLYAANALFREIRHIDLREMGADDFDLLANEIREHIEKEKISGKDSENARGDAGDVAATKTSSKVRAKSQTSGLLSNLDSINIQHLMTDVPPTIAQREPTTAELREPATAQSGEPTKAEPQKPTTPEQQGPATAEPRKPTAAEMQESTTREGPGRFPEVMKAILDGPEEARHRLFAHSDVLGRTNGLADHLRNEIRNRFTPNSEGRYFNAPRGENKMPSIRSWTFSILIRIDPENDTTRSMVLQHLNPTFEPDANVRFWILAQLYSDEVNYLDEAAPLAVEDPNIEVRFLAQAISRTNFPDLLSRFSAALAGDEHQALPALRALRIVPLTEVAPSVCLLLEKFPAASNTVFDALYALSTPEMAGKAAPQLRLSPGLDRVVRLVVIAALGADPDPTPNFARLLDAFDDPSTITILRSLANESNAATVNSLTGFLEKPRDTAHDTGEIDNDKKDEDNVYATIMSSDIIKENKDRLGIQADVQTLTAVMMAKDLEPPLAIGLYGDWGTGKTFFIKSMIAAVERLKKMEDTGRFCREVCQIEFNAWHYVDTNLWASLVSNILGQLAAYISPEKSTAEQEMAIIGELSTANELAEGAEAERNDIRKQLAEQHSTLKRLQQEREQTEVRLGVIDFLEILNEEPALKTSFDKTMQDLGVPVALNSISDLSTAVSEANTLRSRAISLFFSIFSTQNAGWILGSIAIVFLVIPGIIYFWVPGNLWENFAVRAGEITLKIAVIAGGTAKILRTAVHKLQSGLSEVERIKFTFDRKIAERHKIPGKGEELLQGEIAALTAQEQEAEKQASVATAKVVALEEQIRAIREGRSLAKFLAERTNSDDYRKHLGLISTIQKDFRALTERLSSEKNTEGDNLKSVDRIILYIDDLDRCPSDKVMEVLQAVHLLLAYPLFIVVVGVDPRWLLHSLEETYSAFEGNGKKTAHQKEGEAGSNGNRTSAIWRTTPQNYLEKIFQIPFNLKRMNSTGYKDLISGLLGAQEKKRSGDKTEEPEKRPADARVIDNTVTGDDAEKTALSAKPEGEIETVSAGEGGSPDDTGESDAGTATEREDTVRENADADEGDAGQEKNSASDQEEKKEEEQPFLIRNEALMVKDWEIAFAGKLFKLIPTPRSAKRFSNIYRILKARIGPDKLKAFEGESSEKPGTFRNPMVLLAILIGCPEACMKLFPALIECPDNDWGIVKVIDELLKTEPTIGEIEDLRKSMTEADRGEIGELKKSINKIVGVSGFPDSSPLYKEWVPRVSRFSFDVGRAVQALQQDDES